MRQTHIWVVRRQTVNIHDFKPPNKRHTYILKTVIIEDISVSNRMNDSTLLTPHFQRTACPADPHHFLPDRKHIKQTAAIALIIINASP